MKTYEELKKAEHLSAMRTCALEHRSQIKWLEIDATYSPEAKERSRDYLELAISYRNMARNNPLTA